MQILLMLVPDAPIDNQSDLTEVMVWWFRGNKQFPGVVVAKSPFR